MIIKSTLAKMDMSRPIIVGAREKKPEEAAEAIPDVEIRDPEAEFQEAYDELVAAAQEEVALMLEDARAQAALMRAECEDECEKLRADALEEGHRQGLAEASGEMTALLEKARSDIDETLSQAYEQRDKILDECEPRLHKLIIDISEKILTMTLDRDDTAYMSMLKNALSSIKAENKVILHVNTGEYVRFFKNHDINIQTANGSVSATAVSDPTIDSYGCLIETESGVVDAGLGAQLSQIADSFGLEKEND